jgi:imidazolonepropionase-like amidohydrolase
MVPRPLLAAVLVCSCAFAHAEDKAAPPIALRCGRLIDGKKNVPVADAVVIVEGDRITRAGAGVAVPEGARVIDLGSATCLPGLIDNHTHLLLQGDITARSWPPARPGRRS